MKHVLFLCSGNYYRSRFAEEYFNHLTTNATAINATAINATAINATAINATATSDTVTWRALSRGLKVDGANGNVGPMSPLALAALRAQGITPAEPLRMPSQVTANELAQAALVIALKETEHRPLLAAHFPGWEDRVVYWTMHDLDVSPAEQVLPALAGAVRDLVHALTGGAHVAPGSVWFDS